MRYVRTVATIATLAALAACQEDRVVAPLESEDTSQAVERGITDPAKGPVHVGWVIGNDGKTPVRIGYQIVNGNAIHDGDVGIGPADQVAKTAEEALHQQAMEGLRPSFSLHYNNRSYWGDTKGVIPVRRVFNPGNLTAALNQIETQVPGVNFVPYNGQYHHIVVYYGSGSNYYNGCYNGRCEVYIGRSDASKALVMHEFGHALGFQHEIKRCDRNSYIQMLDTRPDASQFTRDCTMVQKGGYDYNSIMHYNSYEFGYRHFSKLNGANVNGYWGRTTISAGDVAAWRNLYPGGGSTGYSATTACQGGYCGPYNLRSGPGTGYADVGDIGGGVKVNIVCQTTGTSHTGPWGTTAIWDKLGSGKYLSDAFMLTGHDGFIPGVPRC